MTSPATGTSPSWTRGMRFLGSLGLTALLLASACAVRGPRPAPVLGEATLSEPYARHLVDAWQHRLAEYIDKAGDGDPAVLARLPALRATGTLRPARISFWVLDLDASVAEADGFDVQGLLLSPAAADAAESYVFVVGIVQRQGYRPAAIADIRLVVMSVRDGRPVWSVGDGNAQALARYRAALDPSAPLRFPADKDDFELVSCAPFQCVEERFTQTRWALPPGR
jgi:hypothetical protein